MVLMPQRRAVKPAADSAAAWRRNVRRDRAMDFMSALHLVKEEVPTRYNAVFARVVGSLAGIALTAVMTAVRIAAVIVRFSISASSLSTSAPASPAIAASIVQSGFVPMA